MSNLKNVFHLMIGGHQYDGYTSKYKRTSILNHLFSIQFQQGISAFILSSQSPKSLMA